MLGNAVLPLRLPQAVLFLPFDAVYEYLYAERALAFHRLRDMAVLIECERGSMMTEVFLNCLYIIISPQ